MNKEPLLAFISKAINLYGDFQVKIAFKFLSVNIVLTNILGMKNKIVKLYKAIKNITYHRKDV